MYDCFDFRPTPPGPRDPSPVPLVEGETYRIDAGTKVMPRVLVLWAPRVVMPEDELRAKCVVIDPGDTGLRAGSYVEPLAHCFRDDA